MYRLLSICVHLSPGSCRGFTCYTTTHHFNSLHFCGQWYAQVTGGKPHSSVELYEKCVFSSTVGLVRPKTRDKWLKVSHDAGSVLIPDVIVHFYHFDCYATSHCKYGSIASITHLRTHTSLWDIQLSLK